MASKNLQENLSLLGLSFLEPDPEFDVYQTILEVVQSHNVRLLEGFPVLLANAVEGYGFDKKQMEKRLQDPNDRDNFEELFLLSLATYGFYQLKYVWLTRYLGQLSNEERSRVESYQNSLTENRDFVCGPTQFSAQRLKNTFTHYFSQKAQKEEVLKLKHEELSLEYALSQVFSPKQKELFWKKVHQEPLTKTEREYFSRTVKKKLLALANTNLHRFAQQVLES